jgi:hypothetical protein
MGDQGTGPDTSGNGVLAFIKLFCETAGAENETA